MNQFHVYVFLMQWILCLHCIENTYSEDKKVAMALLMNMQAFKSSCNVSSLRLLYLSDPAELWAPSCADQAVCNVPDHSEAKKYTAPFFTCSCGPSAYQSTREVRFIFY
jgi:hypothetical protein